jgi:hypothetical protein
VVSALAYGALMSLVLPGTWPLMPFPQTAPVELAALIGLPVGLILRRTWAPFLPFTLLVALNPPGAGFAGALVAFLVVGPFAASTIFIGVVAARRLQRLALRRMISRAASPSTRSAVSGQRSAVQIPGG